MCVDDPVIRELLPRVGRQTTTYGFSEDADVRVEDYQQIGPQGHFTLLRQDKEPMRVTLNAPGLLCCWQSRWEFISLAAKSSK